VIILNSTFRPNQPLLARLPCVFSSLEPQSNGKGFFHRLIYVFVYRIFGFLLGSTLAGAGVYYYILQEYRVSNHLLSEDIYVRLCI
jgi:hypothetical protein